MCCCTLRPSVSAHLCTVAPGDFQGLRVFTLPRAEYFLKVGCILKEAKGVEDMLLGCSPAKSLTLHTSDVPSDGLAERLRDRLRLVDIEPVDADFERGAAFPNDQA